jgi:3'-5' exoribonuclease
MPPIDLVRAAVGDRIHHELLVLDRQPRTTQAGDPFLILTLGNPSGHIETAPIWADKLEWADGAEPGRVVQALGTVTTWGRSGQTRRQLQLAAPLRILPTDQYDPHAFLPRIAVDPVKLWDWIDDTRARLQSPPLRRTLDAVFGDDEFRLQFERWPAAVTGPHARLGGLLLHVSEVTRIAQQIARTLRGASADLVVAGALLHDIGKLDAYAVGPTGFALTTTGRLVGHVLQGVRRLDTTLARHTPPPLSPTQHDELAHLILAQEAGPELGSPVPPATVEAEIIHWADQASTRGTEWLDPTPGDPAGEPGEPPTRAAPRSDRRPWRRPHSWE